MRSHKDTILIKENIHNKVIIYLNDKWRGNNSKITKPGLEAKGLTKTYQLVVRSQPRYPSCSVVSELYTYSVQISRKSDSAYANYLILILSNPLRVIIPLIAFGLYQIIISTRILYVRSISKYIYICSDQPAEILLGQPRNGLK